MKLTKEQKRALRYLQVHTNTLEEVLERNQPEQASYILGALALNMGHLVDALLPSINAELLNPTPVKKSATVKLRVYGEQRDGDTIIAAFNNIVEYPAEMTHASIARQYKEDMFLPTDGEESWTILVQPLD
jgi:hypothetical protein